MSAITETHDHTTNFLVAHTEAFLMRGHLRGQGRISGLSDEDAGRRLRDAQAAMARLAPASVENDA